MQINFGHLSFLFLYLFLTIDSFVITENECRSENGVILIPYKINDTYKPQISF